MATRQPVGADKAGPLTATEVVDEADTAVRAPRAKLSGKRVRAIPGAGGTTVRVLDKNFQKLGISHPSVEWDFRRDNFTLPVGEDKPISEEAAKLLTDRFPTQFEYVK